MAAADLQKLAAARPARLGPCGLRRRRHTIASCTHAGPRPAARRPRGIAQHASHDARPPQTPRPDARGPQLAAQLRDTCPCEKCARAPGRALRRDRETSGEQNCKSSRLFGGLQGQICKSSAVLSPRANLQKQESFGGPTPPLLSTRRHQAARPQPPVARAAAPLQPTARGPTSHTHTGTPAAGVRRMLVT